MAIRDIRIVGDPVLRTPCGEITRVDDRVRTLVTDLLETVDADGRAGLAASQIGVSLRAFSWNIDGELGYALIPRLAAVSEQRQAGGAGWLAPPGLRSPRARGAFAGLTGIDLDGNSVDVAAEWLMARCP